MHTIIETTEKPILGICKGMQLLNVAHGGSLIQDITGSLEHNQGNRRYDFVDTASITDESFLADIFGSEARINSIHHQAVGVLGEGL